jgi:hypothetical protein
LESSPEVIGLFEDFLGALITDFKQSMARSARLQYPAEVKWMPSLTVILVSQQCGG